MEQGKPDLTKMTPPPAAEIPAAPPTSMPPGISVKGLKLQFGGNLVLDNFDFEMTGGDFVALLGSSGVGKSSLIKVIAGLIEPTTGTVAGSDGLPLAGRIAYMGQQDLLYPWLSVMGNVTLGSRLRGERADRVWAEQLLERVGLADRAKSLPMQLSGGMRQRVAIARTLYERKPIVLMDEPFSALDAITRASVQELAAELLTGHTVLLITHDPMEACRLGHRLVVLSGRPAALDSSVQLPGATPRAIDNPHVVAAQAKLIKLFQENAK